MSFGRDVLTPTKVFRSLIASNLYFNFAFGFSTFATNTLEPSFNKPKSDPVFGQ